MRRTCWLVGIAAVIVCRPLATYGQAQPLADYFRAEVSRIAARPLAGIDGGATWRARRPELQRQMLEMLGLWPLPERTDLRVRVTGVVERPEFRMERILFESMPGLFVTANLYLPREVTQPVPAVLYVCGHSRMEKDGVIYGNKTAYQHHASWFASNGFACLVVDSLQLGEIPGLHHGMYSHGMWWWMSRGYTPAGVEAWNGVRAIDYLVSRPEVDPRRLGVTGRSGGGASSWWLGAIDDRLTVVVPVAGITDLYDHVVEGAPGGPYPNGVVEGHCDCMYIANTQRWDYDTVAALIAPRALMIQNTDRDPIFPEAGVRRIYERLEAVYGWYGATDRLALVMGTGGHDDTPELRHAAFAFFQKWLQNKPGDMAAIEEPDRSMPIAELKVVTPETNPRESRNASIHESFVPRAVEASLPAHASDWAIRREQILRRVRELCFAGWPGDEPPSPSQGVAAAASRTIDGLRIDAYDFETQPGVSLRLWVARGVEVPVERIDVFVADSKSWERSGARFEALLSGSADAEIPSDWLAGLRAAVEAGPVQAVVAPRGVGPTAWPGEKDTQIRRRFGLLGQTLDGMRVWDVRSALRVIGSDPSLKGRPVWLGGAGDGAALAVWVGMFEPMIAGFALQEPPGSIEAGPAIWNAARVLTMPEAVALLAPRPVEIRTEDPKTWAWSSRLGEVLGVGTRWPTLVKLPSSGFTR